MEQAMSALVQFPAMRLDVVAALQSLSDPVQQESRWGRVQLGVNYYDDLSVCVNILFDCQVLPNPDVAVGSVLLPGEEPALRAVADELLPLVDELGPAADASYLAHRRWDAVVRASRRARDLMESNDRS